MSRFIVLFALLVSTVCHAQGYTFLDWAHGIHGRSPEGKRLLHIETNHYAAIVDVERACITHYGAIDKPRGYEAGVVKDKALFAALPPVEMRLSAEVNGKTYTCVRAAQDVTDHANYPIRLIDGGRFLHRFDILGLEFETAEGEKLEGLGRLEVSVWPDRLWITLEMETSQEARLKIDFDGDMKAATAKRVALSFPARDPTEAEVVVQDARGDNALCPVRFDPLFGAIVVTLPSRQWNMAEDLDRLDQFPVSIYNKSNMDQVYPIVFAFEDSFQGVTGLCPMLREIGGRPTGIPVQISKNWHRHAERRLLYEGPWFHGVTQIPVAAGAKWEGELAIAYARWGGVPTASHAQLCLIGWGGNQRWDQAAIGSFGESITYDPDVGLNRSHIDDVRPVMVRGMNDGQWEWTHNVGGGNFLVYEDADGEPQPMLGVRTAYVSYGPVLTKVFYGGESADGKIVSKVEVSTPQSDDINRAFHRVRYDVKERTPFSRLAFYQLGADNYNDHQFTTIARGNLDGLVEEWTTERGGKKYLREGMPAEGRAPWITLLGGIRTANLEKGAWADRAIVIREWKARIGGQDVPIPHFASYGTENGPASANAELCAPPGVTELLPGDFVEADIEVMILPQKAEDYYGPNEPFKKLLAETAGTWKLAHGMAVGNDLKIEMKKGTLLRRYPVEIALDESKSASECEVLGGMGYVPVSFSGADVEKGDFWGISVNGSAEATETKSLNAWQLLAPTTDARRTLSYSVLLDGSQRNIRYERSICDQ